MYKVIVADDERWIALGIEKMIKNMGNSLELCAIAEDGVSAFELLLEHKPDIFITDIRMPGLNGLELLEKIRAYHIRCRVIIISGYAEFEYAQKAITLGVAGYLLKPIEPKEFHYLLLGILEELDQQKQEKELQSEEEPPSPGITCEIVMRIRSEPIDQQTTLGDLAKEYGLCTASLSNLLKKELGMPYSRYVNERRIREAKKLLKDETLSLEAIAEKVGYHDYFYFIKIFKKMVGETPAKYRKNVM